MCEIELWLTVRRAVLCVLHLGRNSFARLSHDVLQTVFCMSVLGVRLVADAACSCKDIRRFRGVGCGYFYMGAFRVVLGAAESDASGREIHDEHDFVAKRWIANAPNRFKPNAPVGTLVAMVELQHGARILPLTIRSDWETRRCKHLAMGPSPGGPAATFEAEACKTAVGQKALCFEVVQVRHFELPTCNGAGRVRPPSAIQQTGET